MTDLPQWAMEKARQVIDPIDFGTPVCRALAKDVARALVEQDRIAEVRGIERAAKVAFGYRSNMSMWLSKDWSTARTATEVAAFDIQSEILNLKEQNE